MTVRTAKVSLPLARAGLSVVRRRTADRRGVMRESGPWASAEADVLEIMRIWRIGVEEGSAGLDGEFGAPYLGLGTWYAPAREKRTRFVSPVRRNPSTRRGSGCQAATPTQINQPDMPVRMRMRMAMARGTRWGESMGGRACRGQERWAQKADQGGR